MACLWNVEISNNFTLMKRMEIMDRPYNFSVIHNYLIYNALMFCINSTSSLVHKPMWSVQLFKNQHLQESQRRFVLYIYLAIWRSYLGWVGTFYLQSLINSTWIVNVLFLAMRTRLKAIILQDVCLHKAFVECILSHIQPVDVLLFFHNS